MSACAIRPKTERLQWLFRATFNDSYSLGQTELDQSLHDPGKSAFHDVEVLMSVHRLTKFELSNAVTGKTVSIAFPSCKFSVNGFEFSLGDPYQKPGARLLYFRRHVHDFTASGTEVGHSCTYHIGWQDDAGQRVTMEVF